MARWRGTWEFDGGAFMNQASHYVDLALWLGGTVESVMAKTVTLPGISKPRTRGPPSSASGTEGSASSKSRC